MHGSIEFDNIVLFLFFLILPIKRVIILPYLEAANGIAELDTRVTYGTGRQWCPDRVE